MISGSQRFWNRTEKTMDDYRGGGVTNEAIKLRCNKVANVVCDFLLKENRPVTQLEIRNEIHKKIGHNHGSINIDSIMLSLEGRIAVAEGDGYYGIMSVFGA